jgi:hypothetical protein
VSRGQAFDKALRVVVGQDSDKSYVTQSTLRTMVAVARGDILLASFYVRGLAADNSTPATIEFLFEKASPPWTRSTQIGVFTSPDQEWKQVLIPFSAVDDFAAGEAMVSFRYAFGPQTVEIAGLKLRNLGSGPSLQALHEAIALAQPLGGIDVDIRFQTAHQILSGLGGNFAQARYGYSEWIDPVGHHNLTQLRMDNARIGLPLNHWAPSPGQYADKGPAHAAFLQMQFMSKHGVPLIASVWEGPLWMLPGQAEESRVLPPAMYEACIEAIARFLVTARDQYGAQIDYLSFNEPELGINFKFTPQEMADFIRLAGPRFESLGLKVKFLIGDTATGSALAAYARPLLANPGLRKYLGPLAFHSWDVMSAPPARYQAIRALGVQFDKPVWCTEAGHDDRLSQRPGLIPGWDNALRTAAAYTRTLRLSGATRMDYWTYQDNYPLVSPDASQVFPVWHVLHQLEDALIPDSQIVEATSSDEALQVLPVIRPDGRFAVILVNSAGAGQVRLHGLPQGVRVQPVLSTALSQEQSLTMLEVSTGGILPVAVPARSVLTLVSW